VQFASGHLAAGTTPGGATEEVTPA